jgi:hypothetical protein
MKKKTKEQIVTIVSIVVVAGLIIGLGVVIFEKNAENINLWVMYENCCNGSVCTDTYYNAEDNTCHFVLCEHGKWIGFKDCVYAGANKTITIIQ